MPITNPTNTSIRSCLLTLLLLSCTPIDDPSLQPEFSAETATPIPNKAPVSANPQGIVLWGDLHIHTSYSTDAYTMGVRTTPNDAYTFTRGGEIAHAAGYGIRLQRPLDFAAVTDHSEYLGVLRDQKPPLPTDERSIRQRLLTDSRFSNTLFVTQTIGDFNLADVSAADATTTTKAAWQDIINAAELHYRPGEFTTFVAYEWSSMPQANNLHRNVIYRSTAVPEKPFSSMDSNDPRDLWTALETQRSAGMESIAIPHNGNVSNGKMYDAVAFNGSEFDADYARRRMINEPISEIFQVKGSSETHPELSPNDEFAGFEIYDTKLSKDFSHSDTKGSYIRDALRLGLEFSHSEQFNPYQFGVIAASDGHNASSPVEEDNYHGKLPLLDGSAGLRLATSTLMPGFMPGGRQWSAAGLAAVWATENTREAIFDAMRRKESYATSGPRINLRFYGSWAFKDDLTEQVDWLAQAQLHGVPMGGNLPIRSSESAPRFLIVASKDPLGANLDRIQVIKIWVDESGQSHEKIFNVAWSGDRPLSIDGELPSVGNTVDVGNASYQNTIGATQLAAVWRDPNFLSHQQASYYARVIEIPTPRWTTFDAKTLGIDAPEPSSLQERAVSSAIWYSPHNTPR